MAERSTSSRRAFGEDDLKLLLQRKSTAVTTITDLLIQAGFVPPETDIQQVREEVAQFFDVDFYQFLGQYLRFVSPISEMSERTALQIVNRLRAAELVSPDTDEHLATGPLTRFFIDQFPDLATVYLCYELPAPPSTEPIFNK